MYDIQARELRVEWRGPFHYRQALRLASSGIYLLSVGQEPLFMGASLEIPRALSSHIVFRGNQVAAADMLGRELLKYTRSYHTRLQVKIGFVGDTADDDVRVEDLTTLEDIVSLLTYWRHLPCNPYGRDRYEGSQEMVVTNTGKHHPLDDRYVSPTLLEMMGERDGVDDDPTETP